MPWPCCSTVSATPTAQSTGSPHAVSKERKLTTIAGRGVMALPSSAMSSRDNVPGNFPSFEFDEQAADVVLGEERIDDLPCDGLVAVRDVDEVRPAIDCHHDPRIFAITADERVAELGVLPFAEGFVPVVGVDHRQVESVCEIQREEAERQMARRGIGEPGSDRRAGLAFLRNRREAVVRRCDDVSRIEQAEFVERGANAGEIVIGIADCGEGCRAVDPRNEGIQLSR